MLPALGTFGCHQAESAWSSEFRKNSPWLTGGALDRAPSAARERLAAAGSARYQQRHRPCCRSLACLRPSPGARVRIPYAPPALAWIAENRMVA
jgi:hypothetical protein